MTVNEAITSRRTVLEFLPEEPNPASLAQAVEFARWAPNHKLTEPWRVYALKHNTREAFLEFQHRFFAKKFGTEEAAQKSDKFRHRPAFFVVTFTRSQADPLRDQEDRAATCCFIQNLLLSLWEQGYGVHWSTGGFIREPELFEILGIEPSQEEILGLFSWGRPARIPRTVRRRELADILFLK
jgi:nitroreductase